MRRRIVIGGVVAATLAVSIFVGEFARCRSHAIANAVSASDLKTLRSVEVALGPSDLRWETTASKLGSRSELPARLLLSIRSVDRSERLTISVWERRCFIIVFRRFIVVNRPDGRVIFADGQSRPAFPPMLVTGDQ